MCKISDSNVRVVRRSAIKIDEKQVYKGERIISLEEVERHYRADDFWAAIDGEVYDLSKFKHPGGVIMNGCAGIDATVVFSHYHYADLKRAKAMIRRYKIGKLDRPSPIMGKFYEDLSVRVAAVLKGVNPRPLRGVIMFFVDWFSMVGCVLLGNWMYFNDVRNPILLFLIPYMLKMFDSRMGSQAHALGHLHLFKPTSKITRILEMCMLAMGDKTTLVYELPTEWGNCRQLINQTRSESQYEFYGRRGPYEHQLIHHVKGADMDHDECKGLMSHKNILRLNDHDDYKFFHKFQKHGIYQFLVFTMSENYGLAAHFVLRLRDMGDTFQLGKYDNFFCLMIGLVFAVGVIIAGVLLPFRNLWSLLVIHLMQLFVPPLWFVFYAQHDWGSHVDEATADSDWGRHNAETSMSFWGADPRNSWHPLFLGMGGANGATLSYHLEHTLFPGINYLLLPKIAPTVEQVCKEHNVKYNKLESFDELKKHFRDNLKSNSRPPLKTD